MTATDTTATKRCPGFAGIGQPAHELAANLENFGSNRSAPDGLQARCRPCDRAYTRAWSTRKRAKDKAEALPAGAERDQALEQANQPVEAFATSNDTSVVPAPAAIAARRSTLKVDGQPLAPRPSEQAMAEARGWTIEVVGGTEYRMPTDTETVATPEGQAALEAINAAVVAERRRRDAERKRAERAAKKQQAATTA